MTRMTINSLRPPTAVPADKILKLKIVSAEARPTKADGLHTLQTDVQVVGGVYDGRRERTYNLLDESGLAVLRQLFVLGGLTAPDDDDEIDLAVLKGTTITASITADGSFFRLALPGMAGK